jgi:hypothetical protein
METENEKLDLAANIIIDYEIHNELKTELNKKRKLGQIKDENNKRIYGRMIEERHKLEKALRTKKMNFSELLAFLNKR